MSSFEINTNDNDDDNDNVNHADLFVAVFVYVNVQDDLLGDHLEQTKVVFSKKNSKKI